MNHVLFVSPLSGEGVCLPGQPVHVVLGVQAPGEAAVSAAAYLSIIIIIIIIINISSSSSS